MKKVGRFRIVLDVICMNHLWEIFSKMAPEKFSLKAW
jgi:hypothetical protein